MVNYSIHTRPYCTAYNDAFVCRNSPNKWPKPAEKYVWHRSHLLPFYILYLPLCSRFFLFLLCFFCSPISAVSWIRRGDRKFQFSNKQLQISDKGNMHANNSNSVPNPPKRGISSLNFCMFKCIFFYKRIFRRVKILGGGTSSCPSFHDVTVLFYPYAIVYAFCM